MHPIVPSISQEARLHLLIHSSWEFVCGRTNEVYLRCQILPFCILNCEYFCVNIQSLRFVFAIENLRDKLNVLHSLFAFNNSLLICGLFLVNSKYILSSLFDMLVLEMYGP